MNFILATQNAGKSKEIENVFAQNLHLSQFSLKNISDIDKKIKDTYQPVENGISFLQNAFIKGNDLYRAMEKENSFCIIAEDSGLEVEALNSAPGIYSSRYGKNDPDRINRLLNEMKEVPDGKRQARFITVAVLIDLDGNASYFTGKVEGLITHSPKGQNGFGYDPVFYYPPMKKTFAELSSEEKNTISHRYRAFKNMIHYLNRWSTRLNK